MRIALADDDVTFLAQAARLLEVILEHRGMRAEVLRFESAGKLLASRSQVGPFDMYLLDVVMPGTDGIELGRRIRRDQPDAPLLFFTTSRDFAVEAIGLEAVSYVIKPFTHDAFAEALDRAFRRLETSRPPTSMLKGPNGYVSVPLQNIVCVESGGHYLSVRQSDGRSLAVRLSLQEMWEKLGGDVRFVRVGRQLIVNLAQVKNYTGGMLVLSNGRRFAVPRRSLTDVKVAFSRYYGA